MTGTILELLRNNGVKATFFVTNQFTPYGDNLEKHLDKILDADINNPNAKKSTGSSEEKREWANNREKFINKLRESGFVKSASKIKSDGHAIGIHSYSHEFSFIYKSEDNFKKDFRAIYQLIKFEINGRIE